jgi:preprotein translocase subunit SecY
MQTATNGSIFQYLNLLSGNAFAQATLFALGISPYITASIVLQLLCVAIKPLEELAKQGEEGKKKINQITRYITVALALITAFGYYKLLEANGVLTSSGWFEAVVIIACYVAGSALVMWLAEKINENGIGNGISIILFANIISSLPGALATLIEMVKGNYQYYNAEGKVETMAMWLGIVVVVATVVIAIAMVAFIVWMTNSERRLPVQYAKKVVGRKMYGGQSSNLPIKVNMVGVMPIIFANSIITIPQTIGMFITPKKGGAWDWILTNIFSSASVVYAILTLIMIVAFAYFYIAISFNPVEVANNIKNQGGSILGIRPGRPTAEYISKVLSRITFIGALLLAVVAVFPLIVNICSGGALSALAFGGSSVIIVVGVVLETIREIEGQMTMRHYKGFLE